MSALLRSEILRLASRRLARVLVATGVLGALVVGAIAFAQTSSDPGGTAMDGTRILNTVKGTSAVLALLGWVLGASAIGAEHQSRGLTTTLTFVPSRPRVFLAKAAAALGATLVWALAVLGLVLLALLPAVLAHGASMPGDPGGVDLVGAVLRGTALAGVGAALGFSLASAGRSTAAALGVGFAYVLVVENIVGSLVEGWRRWLLLGNAIVFVSGQAESADVVGRGPVGAGVFFALVGLTLLAGAATAFVVRDVA